VASASHHPSVLFPGGDNTSHDLYHSAKAKATGKIHVRPPLRVVRLSSQTARGRPSHPAGLFYLVAPIQVAGPEFRFYLTNSPRVFVDGQVYGMYFFGYGNYVSAWGSLGFTFVKHLSAKAGYQLGSRLVVNRDTSSNRISNTATLQASIQGIIFVVLRACHRNRQVQALLRQLVHPDVIVHRDRALHCPTTVRRLRACRCLTAKLPA